MSGARYFSDDIGADVDGRRIPPSVSQFDVRRHSCGCHTVFDLDRWRSVTLFRCSAHDHVVAATTTKAAPLAE